MLLRAWHFLGTERRLAWLEQVTGYVGAKVDAGEVGRNLDFILRTLGGIEGFLRVGSLARVCVLGRSLGVRRRTG